MAKKKEVPAEGSYKAKIRKLENDFGVNPERKEPFKIVSTGSHKLNLATRVGGYVRGKIVEIFGPESSGKSTIILHAIAEFQKDDPERPVALFDYEHSFDMDYASSIGVDIDEDKLLLYQPDNQEVGFALACKLAEQGLVTAIFLDSHTAAIPKVVIDSDLTKDTMALQARNNSKFLGKIRKDLDKNNIPLIAISQLRSNLGAMTGEKNTTTGGWGWKFYSDMRFKVWKSVDRDHETNRTNVTVIKNKCGKPFGVAEFDILWGEGICKYLEIIELGVETGVIHKAGSWYSYKNDKLGQGKEAVVTLLKDNDELFEEITTETLDKLNNIEIKLVDESQIEKTEE